jgi:hypothetical protein
VLICTSAVAGRLEEACLLLDTASIDFGTLDFGVTGTASPEYTVTSCSVAAQDLWVHGTDAANANGSAGWSLLPQMPGVDEFAVTGNVPEFRSFVLTTAAQQLGEFASEQAHGGINHRLFMPAAGSAGAGQTMSFDIVWTASLFR